VRTLLVGDEPRDIIFAAATAGGPLDRAFITTAHRGQQRSSADIGAVKGAGDPKLTTAGEGRADVLVFDADKLGTNPRRGSRHRSSPSPATRRARSRSRRPATWSTRDLQVGKPVDRDDSGTALSAGDLAGQCAIDANDYQTSSPKAPPIVSILLKMDVAGMWRDLTSRDWTSIVRFTLPDQDVFVIDPVGLTVTRSYAHVGTTLFNIAVNPVNQKVYVSNTEARNDLRFEGPGTLAGFTLQATWRSRASPSSTMPAP